MSMDIFKAAGIIIRDRKLLVERSKGKEFFIAPGGSIEDGETPEEALVRELDEEFGITVRGEDLSLLGVFTAQAAGQESRTVEMTVFKVASWQGEPAPHSEVEEIAWITSKPPVEMKLGSIFAHDVIPRLVDVGLID